MSVRKIAVVGTGTDVGKTVLSLVIMQYLFKTGNTPLYVKPFQTGCPDRHSPQTDAALIYRHVPELTGADPAGAVINCHENPKAPFFAARDMGQTIDLDVTLAELGKKERDWVNGRTVSHLIIEAAGGLMVPVTADATVADFIVKTSARPVIAAHAGLGTINHTLMTLQCLERHGVEPLGIVFMETGPDVTPADLVAENREAIESLFGIPVAGVIPFMSDLSHLLPETERVVERVLKGTLDGSQF